MKGFSALSLNARELCLVPNIVLPQKFKVSELPKYKTLSCSCSHVTMYFQKMASYIENDELLIHCFQDSLSRASLDWYMGLESGKIWACKDLSDAFLNIYKYNMNMALTHLQLQNPAQRSNETFKEYAQKWCDMASRVRPTLTNTDLIDIFMGTLQSLYYEKMFGSSSSNFDDMVIIGKKD